MRLSNRAVKFILVPVDEEEELGSSKLQKTSAALEITAVKASGPGRPSQTGSEGNAGDERLMGRGEVAGVSCVLSRGEHNKGILVSLCTEDINERRTISTKW